MYQRRAFLTVMLALGLLYLAGTAAAQRIERSTDEQGTIHIGTPPPASQEQAGEGKDEGKTGEVKATAKSVAPEPEPPGVRPPSSRRSYGPAAEARRKAILERRKKSAPPEAPAPEAPPAQPEQPPVPKSQ